jgi:hypothetical protein
MGRFLFGLFTKGRHQGLFYSIQIRQTLLFQSMGIPHHRNKIYWGPRKVRGITEDFLFPSSPKQAKVPQKEEEFTLSATSPIWMHTA